MEENNQQPPVQNSTPEQPVGPEPASVTPSLPPPGQNPSGAAPAPKKKLSFLVGIITIVVIATVAISAVTLLLGKNSNKQVACTAGAKICPDGSSVGRTGPNCEFEECPTAEDQDQPVDPTANWHLFENDKFSIVYPPNWTIDTAYPDQQDLAFYSSDLEEDARPNIIQGFRLRLELNRKCAPYYVDPNPNLPTESHRKEEVTWIGTKAYLIRSAWEGLFFTLVSNDPSLDACLQMSVPSDETFEQNKQDFFQAANSLKLKGSLSPSCTPRPACLDGNPPCMMPELAEYCPKPN